MPESPEFQEWIPAYAGMTEEKKQVKYTAIPWSNQ
jgi:hypothetical protein